MLGFVRLTYCFFFCCICGLQFGNGASLGDANALYFAAGPEDEKDGLFGVLRLA